MLLEKIERSFLLWLKDIVRTRKVCNNVMITLSSFFSFFLIKILSCLHGDIS